VAALRCTKRLLRRLRLERPESVGPAGNALGHWYANILTINRQPLVLAISERSLLSVVVPGAPFSTLLARIPQALDELLRNLSVPERQIAKELAVISPLTVATTASRKVLGCLNQYAFELQVDYHYYLRAIYNKHRTWCKRRASAMPTLLAADAVQFLNRFGLNAPDFLSN